MSERFPPSCNFFSSLWLYFINLIPTWNSVFKNSVKRAGDWITARINNHQRLKNVFWSQFTEVALTQEGAPIELTSDLLVSQSVRKTKLALGEFKEELVSLILWTITEHVHSFYWNYVLVYTSLRELLTVWCVETTQPILAPKPHLTRPPTRHQRNPGT